MATAWLTAGLHRRSANMEVIMDDARFDALSRLLGQGTSRRAVLALLGGLAAAGVGAARAKRQHGGKQRDLCEPSGSQLRPCRGHDRQRLSPTGAAGTRCRYAA